MLQSALLLFPLLAPPPVQSCAQSLELHSVQTAQGRRWYRVYVPSGYDPQAPAPAVLAYHGGGGNAEGQARASNLCATAERYTFLAVFPEGTGLLGGPPFFRLQTWNGGDCCGWAMNRNVDDVGFTRAMLDDMAQKWNVDPGWVFATGLSNGAILCYRLAAELSDRIVAIAPVAGARAIDTAPPRPVPIIAFHGRLDCNVPWQGGRGCGISGTVFLSQRASLAPWVAVNQAVLPGGPAEIRGAAVRYEANSSTTGADIHFWWLRDGGHSWPGHDPYWDPNESTNYDIDANEEMWLFFSRHHR